MKTGIILLMLVLSLLPASSASTYTVCSSGCDAVNLTQADGLVVDGDVIDIQGDILIENMNTITKSVTVEGNRHTINISLPTSSERVIELHGTPAVFNNLTLKLQNRYNTVFLLNSTDFSGRTWNNIRIEAAETVPGIQAGLVIPIYVTGIAIWGSSNLTINNYTSHDILVPVDIRESNYGTLIKSTNITINGNAVMEKNGVSGLTTAVMVSTNVETVSFTGFDIRGYNYGIATSGYSGGSCGDGTQNCFPKNITYKGTLRSNKYGMRMNTQNLTIIDSIFDNDIDSTIIGTGYSITNTSFKTLVSLPGASEFNVSTWAINKVVVDSVEYDVAGDGGYNVTATITTLPPFNLSLSYNKTKVTELNLDPASLKVLHVNAPNETLIPTSIDTTRGILTVETNSFSPFVIYGIRLSSPSTASSSSGSGGYYNPEWYNADGSRRTTPTPTITATATPAPEKIVIPAPETTQPIILTPDLVVPKQVEPSAPEPAEPVSSSGFTIIAGLIALGCIIILVYKFKTKQK